MTLIHQYFKHNNFKIKKTFTPTLSTSTNYTVNFSNALYNPHSGHNTSSGGILSSTGFKVANDSNVYSLMMMVMVM